MSSGGFLISQVKQLSDRTFEKILKTKGIDEFNGAQGRILYILWNNNNLSIKQISKFTKLAKTTLTAMLERMELQCLIKRTISKEDKREIIVSLTDKAKELKENYLDVSKQMEKIFYKNFTDKQIENFENTLKKIIENLEENNGR